MHQIQGVEIMSPGGGTVVSVEPRGPPALSVDECERLRSEFYITSPTDDAYLQEKHGQKMRDEGLSLDEVRQRQTANHAVRVSNAKKRLYEVPSAEDAARKKAEYASGTHASSDRTGSSCVR